MSEKRAAEAVGQVREQHVELIELFYDLIYVYAISRMTLLIEEPEHGVIAPSAFYSYIVVACVIIQSWLYLTNYVNRYGTWIWWEYLFTSIDMLATLYLVNTLSVASDWDGVAGTYNLAMVVSLACVWAMYFIRTRVGCRDARAARNSCIILAIVIALYAVTYVGAINHVHWMIVGFGAFTTVVGMFLPFFIRGDFDASIISFPHLAERFELLTIITFGESGVGMTRFFDVHQLSLLPILIFAVMLLMFGCYVIQMHVLCNHHRVDRALRLMFTHYFIVIAINLVTVGFELLNNSESNRMFVALLTICALAVFYISIYANSGYYFNDLAFTLNDGIISAVSLVIGGVLMVLLRDSNIGMMCGLLVPVICNFVMLLRKGLHWQHEHAEHSAEIAH